MNGIKNLLRSAKFWMAMIIWLPSLALCAAGHVDGNSLAALGSVVSGVFMWSHSKTECAAIAMPARENR